VSLNGSDSQNQLKGPCHEISDLFDNSLLAHDPWVRAALYIDSNSPRYSTLKSKLF
jgi:hypothetical protein